MAVREKLITEEIYPEISRRPSLAPPQGLLRPCRPAFSGSLGKMPGAGAGGQTLTLGGLRAGLSLQQPPTCLLLQSFSELRPLEETLIARNHRESSKSGIPLLFLGAGMYLLLSGSAQDPKPRVVLV